MYCTIEAMDIHEASHGLSVAARLLVVICVIDKHVMKVEKGPRAAKRGIVFVFQTQ